MELKKSLFLAGENLLSTLCPRENYLPYWQLHVDRKYKGEFSIICPNHNIGRWWDAILRIEDSVGFSIPAKIEGAMLENVFLFFDNPDNISLHPINLKLEKKNIIKEDNESSGDFEMDKEIDLHSLRESLLALCALIKYRNSSWAYKKGQYMLKTLLEICTEDCSWDYRKLDYFKKIGKKEIKDPSKETTGGRLIEPLIYFYELTGDPQAFKLAKKLAEYFIRNITYSDGKLNMSLKPTHTHSYLGTLKGLFLFGKLTHQRHYIEIIKSTYMVAVQSLVKESGFACHDLKEDYNRGEVTSPGDAAQLAMWLALEGYTDLFDDTERILRSRLLPSQIVETPDIKPIADDGADEHRNLSERIIGSYGGMHYEPHAGKKSVTDVTAAVAHSIVDIYDHIILMNKNDCYLNFHLDYENEFIKIKCDRKGKAKLTIDLFVEKNLFIRIPKWVSKDSIILKTQGEEKPLKIIGNYIFIKRESKRMHVSLEYGLPVRKTFEITNKTNYEIKWKGDEIIGIKPNSDFFPFYPTIEE